MPAANLTLTGVSVSVVLPSPSWPWLFRPQARTWPLVVRATLWSQPARTEVILVPAGSLTLTGVSLLVSVPLPSCPVTLLPQPRRVPPAAAALADGLASALAAVAAAPAASAATASAAAAAPRATARLAAGRAHAAWFRPVCSVMKGPFP